MYFQDCKDTFAAIVNNNNNSMNNNSNGKTTKKENGSAHAIEDQEKHKALFNKLEVSITIQNMYFFTIGTP